MSIKAETSFSLKDQLFNADRVNEFGSAVADACPGFDRESYSTEVLGKFPELELKQRIDWMVTVLGRYLPAEFPEALAVLGRALPPPLDPTLTDDDFGTFVWVVPGEYVARHGCNARYLKRSLKFLGQATQRFSSESAIRPFLRGFPDQTMACVRRWTGHRNYHVRRLASEGIRPLLPWAIRAEIPAADIIEVLDQLYADSTRYVVRSVANNINDISKSEPALVINTLGRWHKEGRQDQREMQWLTRHALRTLLKQNDPAAYEFLGYPSKPAFRLSGIDCSPAVSVGQHLDWRCTLQSKARQHLKINLRIHFLKANGSHSTKVFSVTDGQFDAGQRLQISKKLPMRPMTTRTLYPGKHYAELVVNGRARGRRAFQLTA
ncbi:MAG: hypothetical protein QNJ40_08130 [Xanthomonadales bacterium]|nr:hypothetical protein [Xanthomonadales bacterium]